MWRVPICPGPFVPHGLPFLFETVSLYHYVLRLILCITSVRVTLSLHTTNWKYSPFHLPLKSWDHPLFQLRERLYVGAM